MLLWTLLLAALSRPAGNYPPADVTLLQTGGSVPLRWKLPGRSFRLEVWQDSRLISSATTGAHTANIEVAPERPVRWRVTSPSGGSFDSQFCVSKVSEYHADGQPGTQTTFTSKGKVGSNGDSLRVRLSRDEDGMHMVLWHRSLRRHYLFVSPGLLFRLTADGGNGQAGIDGLDSRGPGHPNTPGTPGTDAGNGGRVVVSTGNAPWRDYLDISVRGGAGGRGGHGGKCLQRVEMPHAFSFPDCKDGRHGLPGRVETVIQDGW